MEGPSLRLAKEQLKPFIGKQVLTVDGNTKIGKERLAGLQVKDIFSWGKHLVFQFDTFAMRIHFMLYGTYEAVVAGKAVTGDYRRAKVPRLSLTFENGEILMFNCSIKYLEGKKVKNDYDFSTDIMSKSWDQMSAFKKVIKEQNEEIGDVLLDQNIFSGVGNIIKNEALSIVKINPKEKIENLSSKQVKVIVKEVEAYSEQFYKWRKKFILTKNLKIHRKGVCPHCGHSVTHEKTGKRERWSHYCSLCQKL